jgi:hypothetical protein
MTNIDSFFDPSPSAVFRELDGEAVILDLESGRYFGLDAVGTRIWQLIAEQGSLRAVHAALLTEFDVSSSALESDLFAFAGELVSRGLISPRP